MKNPKSPIDKQHNKETLKHAEFKRQQRYNQLNKPEIYNEYEKERLKSIELGEMNFVDYFIGLTKKRIGSNQSSWKSVSKYLIDFTGGEVLFKNLNESWCNDFKEYLLNTKSKKSSKSKLSQNSALAYFNKIKAALRQAYLDKILSDDLNARISPIKAEETRREYLTSEELNALAKTPCNDKVLKRAALFSALTGLRFVDIQKLTWNEVQYIGDEGYVLKFRQKKTKGIEDLPISEQAYELLGERGQPDEKVMDGLKYSAYHNKHLFQWIGAAGITKNITFHCFRHTYATLLLFKGVDLYTVSKMLGHKSIKTTQIYGQIVDQVKT